MAIGVKVRATTSETSSEKVTVRAWSRKIWPATPTTTNTIGRKTATVVRVEAETAPPTSLAPPSASAAAFSPRPSAAARSRRRWMASSTTIELSTSMPTPSASPPSDITFRVTLREYIRMKVAMIEIGIDTPMIRVLRRSRRKTKSTRMASTPPIRALLRTSATAWEMKVDWSNRTSRLAPSGRSPRRRSR